MRLKNIIPCMLAVWAMPAMPCLAQENPSPLEFELTEWDFGTFKEDGGPVSHVFTFRNTGSVPIAIDRVNASCGCTTPTYTRSLVGPGESGSVNVRFDPMGYPGEFGKSVVIVSGGGKNHDMLVIKGNVVPRVKTAEEEYPYPMGGGLRVDNTMLTFRQVAQGKAGSMIVRYVNTSDRSVNVESTMDEASGLLEVNVPENICAGCRGDMTFTYNLTGKDGYYGMIHDVVRLSVDGRPAEKTIYASMTGVDDFSARSIETAPRMMLDGQYHDFGEVRRRTVPYTYRIMLNNDGEEPLNIRSVSEKPGMRATIRSGMVIASGTGLPFEILFYSDKYAPGDLLESIIVITDDPLRPVREIRIAAEIK